MYHVNLVNEIRPFTKPINLKVCDTFLSRFRGYMFAREITATEGLLFVNERLSVMDSSIHMFFMSFDIAVIWLDAEKRVVDLKLARIWRPFYAPRAPSLFTIETHPNRLSDFAIGDQLDFENA